MQGQCESWSSRLIDALLASATVTEADLLLDAWTDALPAVLSLVGGPERGMFRQELQRFCATARFQPDAAADVAPALLEMLLQAARAARRPAAIAATRGASSAPAEVVRLCEHLMGRWRDAEGAVESSSAQPGDPSGKTGEVFFGDRLGGSGRPGAVKRED